MKGTWPLVGRAEELRFIEQALDRPGAGGVVLAGTAGCGKTRLAREALDEAERCGFATEWVVATAATSEVPFGAFAHILPATGVQSTEPLRLLIEVRAILEERAAGKRLLIGVDDIHLLDATSAAFIRQVASRGPLVLGTLRAGEPAPEPVVALWKEGLAERFELQPLGWLDVQRLLEVVLDGPVEGRTLHRLWTHSGGNPLYLRELVQGGVASGALRREGTSWRWEGDLIAARLADLIVSRVGSPSPSEREVLELLAVGEPLGAALLEVLAEPDALESLERKGLVVSGQEAGETVFRLVHPLYADVLLDRLPEGRARQLKRQLMQAIEASGSHGWIERLRLAVWSLELGGPVDASILSLAAHDAADPVVGERLARAALQHGGGTKAQVALAAALQSQGRQGEAERILCEAQEQEVDPNLRAQVASLRAPNLHFGLGRTDDALEVIDQALGADVRQEWRARLSARRSGILLYSGRIAEAIAAATLAAEFPAVGVGREAFLHSHWVKGAALAMRGEIRAARETIMTGLSSADFSTDPYLGAQLMGALYFAEWLAGMLDEAQAVAEAGYQMARTYARTDIQASGAMGLGRVALKRGLVRTAAERLDEAAVLFREYDPSGFMVFCLAGLAQARAISGDASGARAALLEADEYPVAMRIFEPDVEIARAWVAAAEGAGSDAVEIVLGAIDMARELDHATAEVEALHDALRLGANGEIAMRLIEVARRVEGPLGEARTLHAEGVVQRDGAVLDKAAESFLALGAKLLAAECAAQAARLHTTSGRRSLAQASTSRARSLVAECEDAQTPLLWEVGTGAGLTAREREIARLASGGMSNRDIAEQLVVSVRTVDNHLHQAYAKLGVTGRHELGSVLSEPAHR